MGIKCPKCQFENLDESRFCGKCATPLLSPEEISTSPTKTLETPITGLTRSSTFAQRYEVIEELDKGGMGKIYRVFDKKIEQEVALKLLRPEIAADRDTITRFKNELKFARNISHRNVCRMYDLGEEGNAYYITMEYISGENLKSSIRRMERLTVKKAISIAKQVCEGLEEAHRLGVVHRDLKPGNIMIDSEGNARILDFGIARSLRSKGMTGLGVMIGTPEYMSPEQVDGEETDHRSDIYSLGVILYEMATGRVPFKGDTPISVAVKHKLAIPPAPNEVNPQISEDLNRLIMRCLEKDKEKRYQSANELFSELIRIEKGIPITEKVRLKKRKPKKIAKPGEIIWKKAIFRGVWIGSVLIIIIMILLLLFGRHYLSQYKIQKTINSVAVLPLKNLSGDPSWDHFSDRMTEALINELIKTGTLRRVPPSTSVMQYKMAPRRVTEISRELDVEAVVEWSMVLYNDQVQISLKLIEGKREVPVWDQVYARDMLKVLRVQSELASVIAQEIIVQLTNREIP
jgi:serine/threonine protein kinase